MKGSSSRRFRSITRGMDDESVDDVAVEDQHGVDRQERLRQRQPAVGAVVERAFHPLRGGGVLGVGGQADRKPRQARTSARDRIGFRLYAIADEPICFVSNGSSISLRLCRIRRSVPALCADWPMPASAASTWASTLRE